ncbi:MAG: hypothetical protein IT445_10795 [Phycisphaeraceae bacterium]|nr:hypothetical protein [Phycisphaeraceae bacterium]
MIYQNVELHNVGDMKRVQGLAGLRLQRVPEPVRLSLNELAQFRMLQPDNMEIRFKADGPCRITLSSQGQTRLTVFQGLFDTSQRFIIHQQPQTIEISQPEELQRLEGRYCQNMVFNPQVCRIILGGPQRDPIFLHDIQGEGIRPPQPNELPSLRYLTYGTSITHGLDAEGPHLNYVSLTARYLGADLINLGVDGSAHCEREIADYIADRRDWHIASLELSVNMQKFTIPEFHERVFYMINRIAGADPSRSVICLTLFPFYRDFGIEATTKTLPSPGEYRQALVDAAGALSHRNVHVINGPDLLKNISGLTTGLIHPSDYGMIEIAQSLAAHINALGQVSAHPAAIKGNCRS